MLAERKPGHTVAGHLLSGQSHRRTRGPRAHPDLHPNYLCAKKNCRSSFLRIDCAKSARLLSSTMNISGGMDTRPHDGVRRFHAGQPAKILPATGTNTHPPGTVLRRSPRERAVSRLPEHRLRDSGWRPGPESVPPQLRRQPQLHPDVYVGRVDGQFRRRHAALFAGGIQPGVAGRRRSQPRQAAQDG